MTSYFAIAIIILLIVADFFTKGFHVLHAKRVFIWSLATMTGIALITSASQVYIWMLQPMAKYLVPPYASDWQYAIFYCFMNFFLPYVVSLSAAALFVLTAKFMNHKGKDRFFEKEEVWIGGTAIFLSGYPGVMVYFLVLALFYLLIQVMNIIVKRKQEQVPLYHLWLPTAAFAIITSEIILKVIGLWGQVNI